MDMRERAKEDRAYNDRMWDKISSEIAGLRRDYNATKDQIATSLAGVMFESKCEQMQSLGKCSLKQIDLTERLITKIELNNHGIIGVQESLQHHQQLYQQKQEKEREHQAVLIHTLEEGFRGLGKAG